ATVRRTLISIAARISRSARRVTLHLPRDWPWQPYWQNLFDHTHHRKPA
ncbi:IS1380 family transposase, partial [Gordonia amicalis]|nr:IS1380 family transposase [Gordonia amicalis]